MTSSHDDELLDLVDAKLRAADASFSAGDEASVPEGLRSEVQEVAAARREIVEWLDSGGEAGIQAGWGLAGFELLERVGRGGQGEVWRARCDSTKEVVAIKMLPSEHLADDLRVRRFHREVEVAARLDHPALCQVLGSGEERGRPFLVMRFVDGPTVDRHLDALSLQPSERLERAVRMCAQLAEGLAAVHSSGIVHRDIKPGNVRVGPGASPVLVDFGLATLGEPTGSLTGEAIVGTPAYMPPEALAAAGRRHAPHDERSDVWSFGVMLFELTTGQRPFSGPTRQALYQAIASRPARDPRLLNRAVSAELAIVILACLEKRPADRYQSAAQLAVDLHRVIAGQAPLVRRPSVASRLVRWMQDNPALGFAGCVLAAALAISLALLWKAQVAERVAGRALAQEQEARIQSDGLRLVAESHRVAARAPGLAVRLAAEGHDYLAGRAAEQRVVDAVVTAMEAPWEIGVWQLCEGAVCDVSFSPNGSVIWAGCEDGSLHAISLGSSRPVLRMAVSDCAARSVQALANGHVVMADVDGRSWIANSGSLAAKRVPADLGVVTALAASGDRLATGTRDGTVSMWTTAAGEWKRTFRVKGHGGEVTGLDLREGELASCSVDGTVCVWNDASGERLASHQRSGIELSDVALGPGGRRALLASEDNRLLAWGVGPDGPEGRAIGHASGLYTVAYDSTGRFAVTSSFDRTAILWRVRDHRKARQFAGHRRAVLDAEFSPGGEHVVTASEDGTVRLWPAFGHPAAQRVSVGKGVSSASFAACGSRIVASGDKSAAGLWSLETGQRLLAPCGRGDAFASCAVSDAAGLLGVVTSRGRVSVLDGGTGELVRSWPADETLRAERCSISFSPGGRSVLVTNKNGVARLYEVDGSRAPMELRGLAPFYRVGHVVRTAFLSDARLATVVEQFGRGTCIVWDLGSGLVSREWDIGLAPVSSMIKHPHASRLLISHGAGCACELEPDRGLTRRLRTGDSAVTSARYSPGGEEIVATDRDGAIWLWSTADQEQGERIAAHESVAYDACIDPASQLVASASWDGSAALWDLRTRRRLFRIRAHDAPVIDVGFAPDGRSFLTTGEDGTVRTWPVDPVSFVRGELVTGLTEQERTQFAVGAPR